MGHWIPSHAVDPGGGIDLFNAIHISQFLRRHLTGSSLLAHASGGKGEDAARPHSKHAADDSLFTHAHANQRVLVAFFGQLWPGT